MSANEGNPRSSRFSIEELKESFRRLYKIILTKIPELKDFQVENVEPDSSGSALKFYGIVTDLKCQFGNRAFSISRLRLDLVVASTTTALKLLECDTQQYDFTEEFELSSQEIEEIERKFTAVLEKRIRTRLSYLNKLMVKRA